MLYDKYLIIQEEYKPIRIQINLKFLYNEKNKEYIFTEPGFYIKWKKNDKLPIILKLKLCNKNFAKLKKFMSQCN